MENKNSTLLSEFVSYCVAHPEQRFWQALRNWAGFAFVWVSHTDSGGGDIDTFYFEGKTK